MTSRKLASSAAAASLVGVAVLGMAAPAVAQTSGPCYPPPCGAAISDATVVPGQAVTVTSGSGEFATGRAVTVRVPGTDVPDDTVTADGSGNATFRFILPEDTRPGRYVVVFVGPSFRSVALGAGRFGTAAITTQAAGTNTVEVPFTVVAAAAAGPGQGQAPERRSTVLPRTGANQLVPLTIGGVALVGIGAGIVVVARRRRETVMPDGLA